MAIKPKQLLLQYKKRTVRRKKHTNITWCSTTQYSSIRTCQTHILPQMLVHLLLMLYFELRGQKPGNELKVMLRHIPELELSASLKCGRMRRDSLHFPLQRNCWTYTQKLFEMQYSLDTHKREPQRMHSFSWILTHTSWQITCNTLNWKQLRCVVIPTQTQWMSCRSQQCRHQWGTFQVLGLIPWFTNVFWIDGSLGCWSYLSIRATILYTA